MSSPTDQIGNPLMEGDMVIITDGDRYLYGTVTEIKDAGLIAPGGPVPLDPSKNKPRTPAVPDGMEIAGTVRIHLNPMTIPYGSRFNRLPNITKVVKPPQVVAAERAAKA